MLWLSLWQLLTTTKWSEINLWWPWDALRNAREEPQIPFEVLFLKVVKFLSGLTFFFFLHQTPWSFESRVSWCCKKTYDLSGFVVANESLARATILKVTDASCSKWQLLQGARTVAFGIHRDLSSVLFFFFFSLCVQVEKNHWLSWSRWSQNQNYKLTDEHRLGT